MKKPPRPPGAAVTAAEVGRRAGVSQSAVSRAFSPGKSISSKTRQKVLAAADELGYRPNLIARSLMTRRSNIVGLAVAPLENPFYAALVKELAQGLRPSGRHLLLFPAASQTEPDPQIEEVLSYHVDALILASTTLSSTLANRCRSLGVPVLLINRASPLEGVSTITGENHRGGETIARFLLAGGHRRIAYIAGLEHTSTSRDREAGLVEGLRQGGVELFARAVGDYSVERAVAAARALLDAPERPDAIFVANDYMALPVIQLIRGEYGLRVPEDISLVGFDGIPEAGYSGSGLTTYSQPVAGFVAGALSVLDSLIENTGALGSGVQVEGQLIVRSSARLPQTGLIECDGTQTWIG
jgi:DNA-binding LacI/PurR family transcriptional regulator